MKTKITMFLIVLFCIGLAACGSEPMRPIDYPNTTWQCNDVNIKFSVSDDGTVTDASMLDGSGKTIPISIVFADLEEGNVSITSADGTETYLSGTCTYGKDMFSIFVTDIFNHDLNITAVRLTFNRI